MIYPEVVRLECHVTAPRNCFGVVRGEEKGLRGKALNARREEVIEGNVGNKRLDIYDKKLAEK